MITIKAKGYTKSDYRMLLEELICVHEDYITRCGKICRSCPVSTSCFDISRAITYLQGITVNRNTPVENSVDSVENCDPCRCREFTDC